MRGCSKPLLRAAYQGYSAAMKVFDDVQSKDDPMALKNHVVARAYIKQEVLCAVVRNGESLHFETRKDFNSAEYAKRAFKKFGTCRVVFYEANEANMWREIRWKNANVGTMYKRPSFNMLNADKVPENLQLAAMLL